MQPININNINSQYQTPNSQYQTPNPQYQTPNPQYQTPNPQYQTPNFQYQTPNPQYQTPNSQYQTSNSQYQTPMSVTRPIPLQYPHVANPMPIPQPFSPAPTISTTLPNPATSNSNLMDRMQQVQMLMLEINRLESESREGNHQRLQELKRRVAELSAADGHRDMPSVPESLPPPPAYLSDAKSIVRSEHGDGRG
jgi:hypothetical protein